MAIDFGFLFDDYVGSIDELFKEIIDEYLDAY